MVIKALKLLVAYQSEQKDKGGDSYILHPIRLALRLDNEIERAAALLHDIIEDTDCDYKTLKRHGITEEVIDIIKILTHKKEESYYDYISKIKSSNNTIAIKIKQLDLIDNMDLSRLNNITEKDLKRIEKYTEAFKMLLA